MNRGGDDKGSSGLWLLQRLNDPFTRMESVADSEKRPQPLAMYCAEMPYNYVVGLRDEWTYGPPFPAGRCCCKKVNRRSKETK